MNPYSDYDLRVGARTHTGKVRTENQDRMGRFPSPFGELFIVADGMGGHLGGATAAAMTVDGISSRIQQANIATSPAEALKRAAEAANSEIHARAVSGDKSVAEMGSTVVMGLVSGRQITIAHAGDSRAYLFHDDKLSKLTRDHSVVQRMVDHNLITEEQARNHPDSNVITRALGMNPTLELEVADPIHLASGDGILFCSDGLCGYVDDNVIEQTILAGDDPQRIADHLIDLALEAGGEDNVTMQYLQFGKAVARGRLGLSKSESAGGRVGKGRKTVLVLSVLLAVLVAAIIVFGPGLIQRLSGNNGAEATHSKDGASENKGSGPSRKAPDLKSRAKKAGEELKRKAENALK